MVKDFIIKESSELGNWFLNGFINLSYPICLTTGMICLILYLVGIKKFGKGVPASVMIYYCIQCLKVVVK